MQSPMHKSSTLPTLSPSTPMGGAPFSPTGLGMSRSPTGSVGFPATPSSPTTGAGPNGGAAAFVPKLLNKLAAVDERLNGMQQGKVDQSAYERQRDLNNRRLDLLTEDVKQLRADVLALQQGLNQARTTLAGKADLTITNRHRDQLADLTALARSKADGAALKQLEVDHNALDALVEKMNQALNRKTEQQQTDELIARVDAMDVRLRRKAEDTQANSLQTHLAHMDNAVAEMKRNLDDKVNMAMWNRNQERMQSMTDTLRAKADLDAFNSLKDQVNVNEASLNQLTETVGKKAWQSVMEQAQADISELQAGVKARATLTLANQLQRDLSTTMANLNQAQQSLDLSLRQQAEAKAQMNSLHQQQARLQELGNAMALNKADADRVPHLSAESLAYF
eukprot:TRINITY_DN55828_c0_g1_i1.p1 TRINITY_DN55828_c0_g1~~TRINITY_DN55828_c0_g1_i1.p1  ORF type:complete len:394 (-),score=110.51 TRINITY_DN55828_c0_g1_i1:203-1384(-)